MNAIMKNIIVSNPLQRMPENRCPQNTYRKTGKGVTVDGNNVDSQ